MANTLAFKNVTKRFGAITAIDGVSFDIADGETVALLGPSGCGKTTILRMIAGFETPDLGAVHISGADMTRQRPYERNVGLLFQHYALFPHMTVSENVAYGLRYRGYARRDIPHRVAEMLDLVKLPGHGARRPAQLSGGQQQRVALARALATRPGVVLLDEPLSALDAKLRQELRAELKDVLASVGSTTIVVTHDQEEAMSLGERVFVMNGGRIIQQGTPEDVYARPKSRFVAEFMGRSNWFAGSPGGHELGLQRFETLCGLSLAVTARVEPDKGAWDLCIRPECVELFSDTPGASATGQTLLPGRVVDVTLLGAVRQVLVELAGGKRILAVQPNRASTACSRGQPVTVGLPADSCILVPAITSTVPT